MSFANFVFVLSSIIWQLTWSSREFLLLLHMSLMQFMYNERNHSVCYTTATYEVHNFKNRNKRKSLRDLFVFSFILVCSKLRLCYDRNTRLRQSTWWERHEPINHSEYIIGFRSKVFYKSCSWRCWNIHKKILVVQSLKITCFGEHLQTAASIRSYFDTINLEQSGFCTTSSLKILISERKYKNNLENRGSQKRYILKFSYICLRNVLLQSPVYLPRLSKWKSVFFKSVLSSRREKTERVTRGHVKSSQMRNEIK